MHTPEDDASAAAPLDAFDRDLQALLLQPADSGRLLQRVSARLRVRRRWRLLLPATAVIGFALFVGPSLYVLVQQLSQIVPGLPGLSWTSDGLTELLRSLPAYAWAAAAGVALTVITALAES